MVSSLPLNSLPQPPLILFEDDHLLVIHKPSGINTHKPDHYAQDGIHEWLRKQRREWRDLSILHRLDKETSGVMVFGKTPTADRSLTHQFESGEIRKTYRFFTVGKPAVAEQTVSSPIDGKSAQTRFRLVDRSLDGAWIEARPETGRTHQVRRHAAQAGWPVWGDKLYGGQTSTAPRLMLHAWRLVLKHPQTGHALRLEAPSPNVAVPCHDHDKKVTHSSGPMEGRRQALALDCAREFRELLFDESATDSYRLISSAADGFPGWVVDRFGGVLLMQRFAAGGPVPGVLRSFAERFEGYVQDLVPGSRTKPEPLGGRSPDLASDSPRFLARENGLRFLVRMDQGFSPGLFLDQRENRQQVRALAQGKEILNCFAYTCAFSVAAAAGGGRVTSVDLNRPYLDWGRENFRANGLDPSEHDFIYGDVFDWLQRFARRGRLWDVVLLDPPTFGTTKKGRVFRAAKDYAGLARLACRLVRPGGTLFCSTNQRSVSAEGFVAMIEESLRHEKRALRDGRFETQPFDFRVAEGERPYLKTFWATLG